MLVLLLGGAAFPGWLVALIVVAAIVPGMFASVKQKRMDRRVLRAWWQTLTKR